MKRSTTPLRNRLGAIGCGSIALALAMLLLFISIAELWQAKNFAPTIVVGSIAAAVILIASIAFWVGLRAHTPDDDDDLLHGDRGTALAVAAVALVVIIGMMFAMFLNVDFWRGFIEGSSR